MTSNFLLRFDKPVHHLFCRLAAGSRWKSSSNVGKVDSSKVPTLDEKDLEENFISGHGPGGQSVNKSVNCCQIKHLPTGIVVKSHQSRSLEQNRLIAREIMISKLDNLYNGDGSVEAQKKRLALNKKALRDAERDRIRLLKQEFKRINQSTSD